MLCFFWSHSNPHNLIECKTQGQKGYVLDWTMQLTSSRTIFGWRHNGPTCVKRDDWGHCWRDQLPRISCILCRMEPPSNLEFLLNKFNGRLISNKTDIAWRIVPKLNWIDIAWPSNNPDLNHLDFFFWGHSMTYVFHCKLSTIDELKQVVNDFATSMDAKMIKKVFASARKRFVKMHEACGGHLEH